MSYVTLHPLRCFSYGDDFEIPQGFWNLLSQNTFEGEGRTTWERNSLVFSNLCQNLEYCEEYMICKLFAFTLHGHPLQWLTTLPKKSIHSFGHFVLELSHAFHNFDYQAINNKKSQVTKNS